MKVPILAVHHDSQWGQAEIYLKDVSRQRQMGLIYLFKMLLSGIALGETYLISQWILEGNGIRVDKREFFFTEIQFYSLRKMCCCRNFRSYMRLIF